MPEQPTPPGIIHNVGVLGACLDDHHSKVQCQGVGSTINEHFAETGKKRGPSFRPQALGVGFCSGRSRGEPPKGSAANRRSEAARVTSGSKSSAGNDNAPRSSCRTIWAGKRFSMALNTTKNMAR
jgi:hypothetical protein